MINNKIICILVILTLLIPINSFAEKNTDNNIQLWLNGKQIVNNPSPIIVKNRTLVPIRIIAEYFGYQVRWDNNLKKIDIFQKEKELPLQLWIGKQNAKQGKKTLILDVAPIIIEGHTFVPLRFIAEFWEMKVIWNKTTRSVHITSEEFEEKIVSLKTQNIKKLSIPKSKILKESHLNIIKIKDGIFYGIGHHPSGDGTKIKSIYRFDFEGNFYEHIEPNYNFNTNQSLLNLKNNTYYYIQSNKSQITDSLTKVDLKTMKEDTIGQFSKGLIQKIIGLYDNDLYYTLNGKLGLYHENLKTGKKNKVNLDNTYINNLNQFTIIGENLYYQDIRNNVITIYEYNLNSKKISTIITTVNENPNKIKFSPIIGSKKYCTFIEYETKMLYVWDSKEKKIKYQIPLETECLSNIRLYDDRYIVYQPSTKKLKILDLKKMTNIEIKLDCFKILNEKKGTFNWYIDKCYLYGQYQAAFDITPNIFPDYFYRINLKNILE